MREGRIHRQISPTLAASRRLLRQLRDRAEVDGLLLEILAKRVGDESCTKHLKLLIERLLADGHSSLDDLVSSDLRRRAARLHLFAPGMARVSHRMLLEWIQDQLGSNQWTESALRFLIVAGLGIEFLRYIPSLGEYRNHCLISDMLPASLRDYIQASVSVPYGHGTIGWLTLLAMRRRRGATAAALWNASEDPKGYVASHDLLQGNRSWVGMPLFTTQNKTKLSPTQIAGFVFAFFPIDGLFIEEECPESALEPIVVSDVEFVKTFERDVARSAPELRLALKVEENNRLRALSSEARSETGRTEGVMHLLQMLYPDVGSGINMAVEFQEEIEDAKRFKLRAIPHLRERAFVNRWFSNTRIAASYPDRWANSNFILLALVQHWRHPETSGSEVHQELLEMPIWSYGQTLHTSAKIALSPQLYAECTIPVGQALKALAQSVESAVRESATKSPASDSYFERRQEAFVSPRQLLTLHVPLVDHLSANVGFLVIKCNDRRSETSREGDETQRLHAFLALDDTARAFRRQIATLFGLLDRIVNDRNQEPENLRIVLDLRHAVCQALSDWLICHLDLRIEPQTQVDPFGEVLEAFRQIVRQGGKTQQMAYSAALACHEQMTTSFASRLRQHSSTMNGLSIVSVEVWLTGVQPLLVNHEGTLVRELDRELFLADRGALRELRFLVRVAEIVGDIPEIEIRGSHCHLQVVSDAGLKCRFETVSRIIIAPLFYNKRRGAIQSQGRTGEIRRISVTRNRKSTTRVRLSNNTEMLDLTFEWKREPEPVAISYMPGEVSTFLLGDESDLVFDLERSHLNTQIRDGKTGVDLDSVLMLKGQSTNDGHFTSSGNVKLIAVVSSLNRVAGFLANDPQRESYVEPTWVLGNFSRPQRQRAFLISESESSGLSSLLELNVVLPQVRLFDHQFDLEELEDFRRRLKREQKALSHEVAGLFPVALGELRELSSGTSDFISTIKNTIQRDPRLNASIDFDMFQANIASSFDKAFSTQQYLQFLIDVANRNTGALKSHCEFRAFFQSMWRWCAWTPETLAFSCEAERCEFRYSEFCIPPLFFILSNFISNARKHGNRRPPAGYVQCTATSFGISIQSFGSTMPQHWIDFLQDPSAALPASTRQGLAIAISYFNQYGLTRPAVENNNDGTRLTFDLPKQPLRQVRG